MYPRPELWLVLPNAPFLVLEDKSENDATIIDLGHCFCAGMSAVLLGTKDEGSLCTLFADACNQHTKSAFTESFIVHGRAHLSYQHA